MIDEIIGTPMPADHAGRADRAGADADLHGVAPSVDEGDGRGRGRDVAADELHVRELAPQLRHQVDDDLVVPVRGVDDERVHAGASLETLKSDPLP